jgi:3-deoxy-7-phosphoheptulonate synthase
MSTQIGVSILGCDYCNLKEEIQHYKNSGIDFIHIDIFDGKFVPTFTFGIDFVKSIKKNFPNLFLDCHLAVEYPNKWVKDLIKLNVSQINIHYESFSNINDLKFTLDLIKQANIKAGLVLNPISKIDIVDDVIDLLDNVLIMTVRPGYGGLKLNTNILCKVKKLRNKYDSLSICVDGGVKVHNSELCILAGASSLICGSALTNSKKKDTVEIIKKLKTISNNPNNIEYWRKCDSKHVPIKNITTELENKLKKINDIVNYEEIIELTEKLKNMKNNFILSLGPCSENINNSFNENIDNLYDLFCDVNNSLKQTCEISNIIPIYRACGQILKPRTSSRELLEDKKINTFWGLNINTLNNREINENNLIKGVNYSKNAWEYLKNKHKDAYISHEALLIPLEYTATKLINKKYYNTSAHLLWVGNKTKQLNNQQIQYLKCIENPIGIKIDKNTSSEELIKIIKELNPYNLKGKIILIPRIGNKNSFEILLKSWIQAITKLNLEVIWCSDPMHGNTEKLNNQKVRYLDDIKEEIIKVTNHIRKNGEDIKGLMFESSNNINIEECIEKKNSNMFKNKCRNYKSLCDPRINKKQLINLIKSLDLNKNYGDICIILAKKGSVGLPNKNKMMIFSKKKGKELPLFLNTYYEVLDSKKYKKIYISTNDEEIINVCKNLNIQTIHRDDILSQNNKYIESVGFTINKICENFIPKTITIPQCVQPFYENKIFEKMLTKLHNDYIDSVITIKNGPGCAEWILRAYNTHNNEYRLKPILYNNNFNNNSARQENIYEIDNAIVSFKFKSFLISNSALPWPYLGNNIIGIKQKFKNSNISCDINYEDDYIWSKFLQTYNSWESENIRIL